MMSIFDRLKHRISGFEVYTELHDWQFNEKVIQAFRGLNEKQKEEIMICIVEKTKEIL